LSLGGFGAGLGEGGRHEGRDDAPAALAGVGERVAHGVDSAAPPGGVHQLGDGGLDALVGVGDDELDAAQAAPPELAQELGPEEPAPAKAGVSAPEGPMSMPITSRRPSALTPTATITATETMRWLRRTFT
jgi:hypothetical protein